jgi:hypothetical protein
MKMATVEAMFPELKVKDAYQTGRGKGSSSRIAIQRAIAAALKQVSGKRITTFKATITVVEMMEEQ